MMSATSPHIHSQTQMAAAVVSAAELKVLLQGNPFQTVIVTGHLPEDLAREARAVPNHSAGRAVDACIVKTFASGREIRSNVTRLK